MPLWLTRSVTCCEAPASCVSLTRTVPSFGWSIRPSTRPSPTPRVPAITPRSRGPAHRGERIGTSTSRAVAPSIQAPTMGTRARRRADTLPRTGEPNNTIRPGGNAGAASNSSTTRLPPMLCATRCKVSACAAAATRKSLSAATLRAAPRPTDR